MVDPIPPSVRAQLDRDGVQSLRGKLKTQIFTGKWKGWIEAYIAEHEEREKAEHLARQDAFQREANEAAQTSARAAEVGNDVARDLLEQAKRSADAAVRSAEAAERSARAGERSAAAAAKSARASSMSARWAVLGVLVGVLLAALAKWSIS